MLRCLPVLALACAAPLVAQSFFPPPRTPSSNPVTNDKTLLGMTLFWEEQLSHTDTVACGTCHQFRSGGGDPRAATNPGLDGVFGTPDDIHGSMGVKPRNGPSMYYAAPGTGVEPQVTRRKAPSVVNAGYSTLLFYDGRASSLEELVMQPILNPVEMGFFGRSEADVVQKLTNARPLALATNVPTRVTAFIAGRGYPALFAQAFGSTGVTGQRIAMAIATYIRTLNSDQTDYDRFVAGQLQLTSLQNQGLALFNRAVAGANSPAPCSQCHGDITPASHTTGPTFETLTYYGSPQQHNNFHNTGVRPIAEDPGRGGVGAFKVPLLRNVALRGPFFHNGQMADLAQVLDYYSRGGDFHVNQAPEIRPINFTLAEKTALLAFFGALTDVRVQNETAPFDRPTLWSERGVGSPGTIGTGMTAGNGQLVRVVAEGPAFVGKTAFLIGATGVESFQTAFLLWDVSSNPAGTSIAGMPFYLGLTPSLAVVNAGWTFSSANFQFPIPNNNGLAGTTFYAQWVVTDSHSPSGLVTSDALSLPISQ